MLRSGRLVTLVLLACGLGTLELACQTQHEKLAAGGPTDSTHIQRGQRAYLAYCAMCHGPWGEGNGPLAAELKKLAGVTPAHLNDQARLTKLGRSELVHIITVGGGKTHRSNLMPPWGSKMSADVIGDIADFVLALPTLKPGIPRATIESYLHAPPGTPADGRKLFVFHCTICHGPYGKGDGFLADSIWVRNNVRPRNLTDSVYIAGKTDQELYETIALGGGYTGHSGVMPAWSVDLAPHQLSDLVSYVRVISRTAPRR